MAGVHVVLSAVSEQLRTGLKRTLPPSGLAHVLLGPNTDRALERCEEIVIAAWRADASTADERRKALSAIWNDRSISRTW